MKTKFLYSVLVLGLIMLLGSCEKDGVYNPKEKISKIYVDSYISEGVFEKKLSEVWNWDKKQLQSIDYYGTYSGELRFTCKFKYDGNRLSEIMYDDDLYKYSYDGKNLSKVEEFSGSELSYEYVFSYDGKNMIKTTITDYPITSNSKSNKLKNKAHSSILDLTIGAHIAFPLHNTKMQEKKSTLKNQKKSSPDTYVYHHEYDGKQLVKTYVEETEDGYTNKDEANFQYDNEKNPFEYNLFYADRVEQPVWMLKNNITRMDCTGTEIEGDETFIDEYSIMYKYEYNKKGYPTLIIEGYDGNWDDDKTYIEYE